MTTIKELLPISNNKIGEEEINAVSARDLHKFLGITERFQQWINKQLSFGFEENVDFVGCKIFNTLANLELQDYCLSLDCAKQVAMIQRNEKGTEARKYFIECEKQLQTRTLPQTYSQALRELADSWDREQLLIEENKAMKPKAKYFDDLVDRNLLTNFRDTAKELKIKQNDFINYLLEHNYVYRDNKNKLKPCSQYTPELFELKEFRKGKYTNVQTLITPKGRETFRLLIV